jgi:tetratricopeptide (TPR) repeat protein
MSIGEFKQLQIGGLVSFNSFLSTSADKQVSLLFARPSLDDSEAKAVLFVIHVDLALTASSVGFLDDGFTYFYGEKEYLWGMNTVFCIDDIREAEDGLCQVKLIVTRNDDSQLKQLTDYMRREVSTLSGLSRLGNLMIEMGERSKAKDIYETLLQEEADPCTIQQLGFIAHQMNDLDTALGHYRRALSLFATSLSPNDHRLATIYSNIGCVLNDNGRLREALNHLKRTIELHRSLHKPDDLHIVCTVASPNLAKLLSLVFYLYVEGSRLQQHSYGSR